MSPKVSCLITAHDRPKQLADAIRSVLAQSVPIHEIVVVDDASKSDLECVVRSFDHPIRYTRLQRNSGANVARNRGLSQATGDVVAMLDDDDIWHSDKLERQITVLQGSEACLCGFRTQDGRTLRVQPLRQVTEEVLREGNKLCGMSGLVASRDALLREPFDEDLPKAQDWDVFVRLAKHMPLAYVPEALFTKATDLGPSITSTSVHASIEDLDRRTIAFDKHQDWLGDRYYRQRLAETLLAYFPQRKDKVKILLHSVRRAGIQAVVRYVLAKLSGTDRDLGGPRLRPWKRLAGT